MDVMDKLWCSLHSIKKSSIEVIQQFKYYSCSVTRLAYGFVQIIVDNSVPKKNEVLKFMLQSSILATENLR